MANPNNAWKSCSKWALLDRSFERSSAAAEATAARMKDKHPGAIVKTTQRAIYNRYAAGGAKGYTQFTVSAYAKP